jgi:hypothetical protein
MFVEHHSWDVLKNTDSVKYRPVSFDRIWLEFSDDGELHDPTQLTLAREHISDLVQNSNRGVYIVAFVHGHNQNADNRAEADERGRSGADAVRFDYVLARHAETLRRLYEQRGSGTPPQVVGVFVGWRGNTTNLPILNRLSLGNRAATANQLGENRKPNSLYDALSQLRGELSERDQNNKMLVYGHSLGGRMLSMMMMKEFDLGNYNPFGHNTLVVALEPALGADCYARYLGENAPMLTSNESPSLWTLTSLDDVALDRFYPIAVSMGIVAPCTWSDERARTQIGLFNAFVTHDLRVPNYIKLEDSSQYSSLQRENPRMAYSPLGAPSWTETFGSQILAYPLRDLDCSVIPRRCYDTNDADIYTVDFRERQRATLRPTIWNIATDRSFVDWQGEGGGGLDSTHNGYISTNLTRLLIEHQFR